jgi:hypothetical protein
LYSTGSGGTTTGFTGFKLARKGFAAAFTLRFAAVRFGLARLAVLPRRAPDLLLRAVLVARIASTLARPLWNKLPGFSLSYLSLR